MRPGRFILGKRTDNRQTIDYHAAPLTLRGRGQLSGEEQIVDHPDNSEGSSEEEHAGVAQCGVDDGNLGLGNSFIPSKCLYNHLSDDENSGAVCQGLGEQEPEVCLVMNRTKGLSRGCSYDGVNTGEGSVQDDHHQAVASLGGRRLLAQVG